MIIKEYLRHTLRYSVRSSPICLNFEITTFKAKNVFLVFGKGHTMNKYTYKYKKHSCTTIWWICNVIV